MGASIIGGDITRGTEVVIAITVLGECSVAPVRRSGARPGAMIGVVGLPHGDVPTDQLFWQNKGFRGGPAPVRAYLPHLLDLVLTRAIDPGKVFDLTLPLADVAEAYKAMDERRAIKVLLQP